MKKLTIFILLFLLSGCLTPEQIAEQQRQQAATQQAQLQYAENEISRMCAERGVSKKTKQYPQCRQQVINETVQQIQLENQATIIAQQQQMIYNQQTQQQFRQNVTVPYVAPPKIRTPINCTTSAWGRQLNTSCY